jgi:hypothetical protein
MAAETALQGRYLLLQLAVEGHDAVPVTRDSTAWITLVADRGRLWARPAQRHRGLRARAVLLDGQFQLVLQDRVPYYFPDHAAEPRPVAPEGELWVEVSLPREGPPRALRLGVHNEGMDITPLVPSGH